ncbi:hypothetical protein E6C67_03385 (plasmid) [Azospirillum sp. TSA2s]|uniref:hypothetical protein n=1 Tax=Azospirillum sp. TSA2s TaxID=709810 RepID=UPI0010A9FBD3|nr:hypothetical protein [Azospirillum sp. TSA2s]QCG93002.1 hypothetical protein E6C67_03385 [Azospirillum sp. TSA2s]
MTHPSFLRSVARPAGLATTAGLLAVLAASLAYYRLYIDSGLNTADDGHYAQVAYELLLGTDPHAISFAYGLMWFKLGQLLFTLTGPSWHSVQLIFYAVITATSLLVYATVLRVTGRQLPALLAAAVAVAVPAFPPTSFYAFCTLLNVFCQVRLADRWQVMRMQDVLLPAAALSLTFQVRADFGYLFAVPLAGLLLLGACAAPRRAWPGIRQVWPLRLAQLAGTALAAFLVVQLPVLLRAATRGYLDLVVTDVLRYPLTILTYLLAVFHPAGPGAATRQDGAGTLLARPPLHGLWDGLWAGQPDALMAALVYGPLLVMALYLVVAGLHLRHPGGVERLPVLLVVLAGALATLPHYFFFRPDLAHVANFMPGFLVLGGTLLGELASLVTGGGRRARTPWRAGGLAAASLVAATPLVAVGAIYLCVGLTTPGTGSIAASLDRTAPFSARNVTEVRVNAGELAQLTAVRNLIEAASAPGDPIVCVPFCPGIAFMTGRRMLLHEYFVDDSFLLRDPGWIDRAIATTRQARPPVVIVVDWAIHGTDISRFQNWAHRYIDALVTDGYARSDLPGIMAYRRPG